MSQPCFHGQDPQTFLNTYQDVQNKKILNCSFSHCNSVFLHKSSFEAMKSKQLDQDLFQEYSQEIYFSTSVFDAVEKTDTLDSCVTAYMVNSDVVVVSMPYYLALLESLQEDH